MAITFLKVKVSNPEDPLKSNELEFLVDSGTIYTVVPEEELKRLKIKPTSFEEFILANGEIIKKPVGNAYFEYKETVRAATVIFGEKKPLLLQ